MKERVESVVFFPVGYDRAQEVIRSAGGSVVRTDPKEIESYRDSLATSCTENLIRGLNSFVVCFGDTNQRSSFLEGIQENGLYYCLIEQLFQQANSADRELSFRVEVSLFEVLGNHISDLFSTRTPSNRQLGNIPLSYTVKDSPEIGPHVDGVHKHLATTPDQVRDLVKKGLRMRKRMATLNSHYLSCSSLFFSVILSQGARRNNSPFELRSQLVLVEVARKDVTPTCGLSLPEEKPVDGITYAPLEHLHNVLSQVLSRGDMVLTTSIPFRKTSLTWLLKEALGGNCKATSLVFLSTNMETPECDRLVQVASSMAKLINRPVVNEEYSVRLLRDLQLEIAVLKGRLVVAADSERSSIQLQLKKNEDLAQRITGVFEDKWSKTKVLMEGKSLSMSEQGLGLKVTSTEPHFISLGGGRLSVGMTMIPVKKGKISFGVQTDSYKPDYEVRGKGVVEGEHCVVSYDGDSVILHPNGNLCSVDGRSITDKTKLYQGAMVCIGSNTYFRFNHPQEAQKMRDEFVQKRFSVIPDQYYPDIQLAIELHRKEQLDKEKILIATSCQMEKERVYSVFLEKLALEKKQMELERSNLNSIMSQHDNIAKVFDHEIQIHLEELRLRHDEVVGIQSSMEALMRERRELDMDSLRLSELQARSAHLNTDSADDVFAEKTRIELDEFEALEQSLVEDTPLLSVENTPKLVSPADKLLRDVEAIKAKLEMDSIQYELQKISTNKEKSAAISRDLSRLDAIKQKHLIFEHNINNRIEILSSEKKAKLESLAREKTRLIEIASKQERVIFDLEEKILQLELERTQEKSYQTIEDTLPLPRPSTLVSTMPSIVGQSLESDMVRLEELEDQHLQALKDLQASTLLTEKDRLDKQTRLELEYLETEQLLLEELDRKQTSRTMHVEEEVRALREQLEMEREAELQKLEQGRIELEQLVKRQGEALAIAEQERARLQVLREREQEALVAERARLAQLESEYAGWICAMEVERQELVKRSPSPDSCGSTTSSQKFSLSSTSSFTFGDFSVLKRVKTPEDKQKQIDEERTRLEELKRQASVRAEMEWLEKKQEVERRRLEEQELEEKRRMLEELRQDQEKMSQVEKRLLQDQAEKIKEHELLLKAKEIELECLKRDKDRLQEVERLLAGERLNESVLERSLIEERERTVILERSLAEERNRRENAERQLLLRHAEQASAKPVSIPPQQISLTPVPNAPDDRGSNLITSTPLRKDKSLLTSLSPVVPAIHMSDSTLSSSKVDATLAQLIVSAGHVLEGNRSVNIDLNTCRGYLQKMRMNGSWLRCGAQTWPQLWFVFDRKQRCVFYYGSEHKSNSNSLKRGVIYFQAIQEVYVDASFDTSPNPSNTFCVKTPSKTYVLVAPSASAMGIWIDVLCLGK